MKNLSQRVSWGFSLTPSGTAVIRNWSLLLLSVIGVFGAAFIWIVAEGGSRAGLPAFASGLLGGLIVYSIWSLYLEIRGIQITKDAIRYPVRLGSGVLPLFRKALLTRHVLQASSAKEKGGLRIAYLSGNF